MKSQLAASAGKRRDTSQVVANAGGPRSTMRSPLIRGIDASGIVGQSQCSQPPNPVGNRAVGLERGRRVQTG